MDQNDLQDNGQWDLYQNLTEYASRVCPSYSVKIILKYSVFFFQTFYSAYVNGSERFTGQGPMGSSPKFD